MPSQKRSARRARRWREFLALEGPYALRHDRRTWASENGGHKLSKGDMGLLRKYKDAENLHQAQVLSIFEGTQKAMEY